MSTPTTVDRAFEAALYDKTDTSLDAGASLLAADPAADAELARRGEEFVAAAWRRGWQPADVVRAVRRELDDVHVRLAVALLRAQAPRDRPRGPRRTAQLGELTTDETALPTPPNALPTDLTMSPRNCSISASLLAVSSSAAHSISCSSSYARR